MADYHIKFSLLIDDLSQEEIDWVARALAPVLTDNTREAIREIRNRNIIPDFEPETADMWPDFESDMQNSAGQTDLWLYSETTANLDHLDAFLISFLRKFRPDEIITYTYADTCSKPRVDAFGGGAVVITADGCHYMHTHQWLERKLYELRIGDFKA